MTVTLTPLGSSCQVHYYLPYYTGYDIFITCTASNAYGSDSKTYRLICQYYSSFGFASLAFEKDNMIIYENPILVSSKYNPGVDVTDYYLINEKITPENGTIKFFLHEAENVEGYINLDQVELWQVKANKNEFAAITEDGEIISYKKLENPDQVILNNNQVLTNTLADIDEIKVTVKKGDKIKTTLPSTINYNIDELYSVIHAQLSSNAESGLSSVNNNFSKYYFRPQPSTVCKKVNNIQDGSLEIEFAEDLIIDYFAIVKNEKTAKGEKLNLLGAVQEGKGDVSELLTRADADYGRIYSGENIEFIFESKNNSDENLSYILKTVGKYEQNYLEMNKKRSAFKSDKVSSVQTETELNYNYPNPFNPTTSIIYTIPESSFVTLKVYDLLGREVTTLVNENKSAGRYTIEFNASNLPSGTYIYKLSAGNYTQVRKMLLVK